MPVSRTPMKQAPALTIALSASFAVLLLGVLAQNLPSSRDSLHESVEPDMQALLPVGAEEATAVELPDAPQTARVSAFTLEGKQSFAIVVWDRDAEGYRLSSTVDYEAADEEPLETVSLEVVSLGLGAPVAFIARGPLGASTELATVFARVGDELRPVMLVKEDGRTMQAQFVVGASATRTEDIRLEDVDGDGDKDALVTVMEMPDGVPKDEIRTVYSWNEGMFSHDTALSRILSLRGALFPEPDLPSDAVVDETVTQE